MIPALILVTSLVTFMLCISTLILLFRTTKMVQQVQTQVTTINGSTVAQLADARETRRVGSIAPADRTVAEYVHLAVVPPPVDGVALGTPDTDA